MDTGPDAQRRRAMRGDARLVGTRNPGCPSIARAPALADRAAASDAAGLLKTVGQLAGAEGLRQFKDSIADKREPLCMSTPSPAVLTVAGLDIGRAIRNPAPR